MACFNSASFPNDIYPITQADFLPYKCIIVRSKLAFNGDYATNASVRCFVGRAVLKLFCTALARNCVNLAFLAAAADGFCNGR